MATLPAANELAGKLEALATRKVEAEAREARLAVQDDRVKELERERTALRQTEQALKKELKTLAARDSTMQAELEDLRTQVLEIPALRKHFDSLTKEHAESKSRRQQVAADLRTELATARTTLSERETALAAAVKRRDELEVACQAETARCEVIERARVQADLDNRALIRDLSAAATAIASSRAEISAADMRELDDHIHVHHLRANRLERQVADRDAQSAALVELVRHLEADRDHWRDVADELQDEAAWMRREAALDRAQAAQTRREAEREAMRALEWLDEVEEELDEARRRIAIEATTSDLLSTAAATRLRCLDEELRITRSTLSTTEAEASSLAKRLATAEAGLEQATTELEAAKAELADTREDRDDALRARHKAEASLVEASEARQRLTGLLTQSRAAEAALEEELQSAEASLAELQGVQEAHARLRTTLETLSLRNDLAERDAAAVSALNAELGGHATSQQKIHHLAKVRHELAELRRKHAAGQAELAASRREADALRTEVESYKAVGSGSINGVGAPQSKLARVLRPIMADVVNRRV